MLNKCYLLIPIFFNSNVLKQMPNMFQKSEAWLFLKRYSSEHAQIQEAEKVLAHIFML